METYYGVIYFKNGTKREIGSFRGPGAAAACERNTAREFEVCMKHAVSDLFKPTRYEVKTR